MFDWFWEFLYLISKSLFRIIDAMFLGAKKLCGIEPISVDLQETDFLTFLFDSHEVKWSFVIACLLALVVLCIFSVIAVIRTTMKDRSEGSPVQIVVKAVKAVLLFLCVPAIMYISMWFGNAIVNALNEAVTGSSTSTLGSYLFIAFAEDMELYPEQIEEVLACSSKEFSYVNTDYVWTLGNGNLKSFDFILSWICGIAVLFPVATTLVMFVERAISIVILFIVSPFSIATTVIDDGSHFKLWRDQVLVKFITGYGAIIALNIYVMVVEVVYTRNVVFFPESEVGVPILSNTFLNTLMKLCIIIGGAFSMQKIQAVIGNLVQAGAGSNEMREAADAGKRMGGFVGSAVNQTYGRAFRAAKKVGGLVADATGVSGAIKRVGEAWQSFADRRGAALLGGMGLGGVNAAAEAYRNRNGSGGGGGRSSNSNNEKPAENNEKSNNTRDTLAGSQNNNEKKKKPVQVSLKKDDKK